MKYFTFECMTPAGCRIGSMGQEIVYCVACQIQLRSASFGQREAFDVEGTPYCKACIPMERLGAWLKDEQLSAPEEPAPAAPQEAPKSGTGRHATVRPSADQEGSGATPIATALATLLGLALLLAMLGLSDQ